MIPFQPPPDLPVGPLRLTSHGALFLAGALAAYVWTRRRAPEAHRGHLEDAACWMTLGGIAGARLLFVVLHLREISSLVEAVAVWDGGLVSYGGMGGATLAWWLWLRSQGMPVGRLSDALAPPALLGWGIGRIGCLLTWYGEYGTVTDVPWAFLVDGGPPRHPVMLYTSAGLILAAFLLVRLERRFPATGMALIAYGSVRLACDFFRQWDPPWLLHASQGLSAVLMAAGWAVILRRRPFRDS